MLLLSVKVSFSTEKQQIFCEKKNADISKIKGIFLL